MHFYVPTATETTGYRQLNIFRLPCCIGVGCEWLCINITYGWYASWQRRRHRIIAIHYCITIRIFHWFHRHFDDALCILSPSFTLSLSLYLADELFFLLCLSCFLFFWFSTIRYQFDDIFVNGSTTWMSGDKLKWSFCCFTSINKSRWNWPCVGLLLYVGTHETNEQKSVDARIFKRHDVYANSRRVRKRVANSVPNFLKSSWLKCF